MFKTLAALLVIIALIPASFLLAKATGAPVAVLLLVDCLFIVPWLLIDQFKAALSNQNPNSLELVLSGIARLCLAILGLASLTACGLLIWYVMSTDQSTSQLWTTFALASFFGLMCLALLWLSARDYRSYRY